MAIPRDWRSGGRESIAAQIGESGPPPERQRDGNHDRRSDDGAQRSATIGDGDSARLAIGREGVHRCSDRKKRPPTRTSARWNPRPPERRWRPAIRHYRRWRFRAIGDRAGGSPSLLRSEKAPPHPNVSAMEPTTAGATMAPSDPPL